MEYGYDMRSLNAGERAAEIARRLVEREIRFEIRPFDKTGFTVFVNADDSDELDRAVGYKL